MNFATIAAQLTADKPKRKPKGTHGSVRHEVAKHNGITTAQLAKIFDRAPQSLRITLGKCRGVYVGSWYKDKSTRWQWAAIWMAGDKESAEKPCLKK